jgi:hypothetical protein
MKMMMTILAVVAASGGTAVAQTPIDAVSVDCAAFVSTPSSEWVVTKTTTVFPGPNNTTAGKIELPPGLQFGKNKFRTNGADLADVLDQRCKRTSTQK